MTMQIVIDQEAPSTLELVQRLTEIGEVNHQGDGFYIVQAPCRAIWEITDQYPGAVLKDEILMPAEVVYAFQKEPAGTGGWLSAR